MPCSPPCRPDLPQFCLPPHQEISPACPVPPSPHHCTARTGVAHSCSGGPRFDLNSGGTALASLPPQLLCCPPATETDSKGEGWILQCGWAPGSAPPPCMQLKIGSFMVCFYFKASGGYEGRSLHAESSSAGIESAFSFTAGSWDSCHFASPASRVTLHRATSGCVHHITLVMYQ